MDAAVLTARIKERAREIGFDVIGITNAEPFDETGARLQEHIAAGYIAGLAWFTPERAAVSSDARNLMPNARSIISLGVSYLSFGATEMTRPGEPHGRVARYAWGRDYHLTLKDMMAELVGWIGQEIGVENPDARLLTDTARIVDRAVAQRAGIGFFGKNANIINPDYGSWLLLAEILTDLDLVPDAPGVGTCGTCTRCIDACPTDAIRAPGVVHNDRCISYLTIELKGAMPRELREGVGNWVFGCDICQEVCPYNHKPVVVNRPPDHASFRARDVPHGSDIPPSPTSSPNLFAWLRLTEDDVTFRAAFKDSPISRPKRAGLRRNMAVALGNTGDSDAIDPLSRLLLGDDTQTSPMRGMRLARDPDPVVRGHAAWALGRTGGRRARRALERAREIETDDEVQAEIARALEEM